MSSLAGISGREAVRRFEHFGYRVVRQRGSHVRLRHSITPERRPLTVPLHRELKVGLLRQLIRDAALAVDEFLDAA